MPYHDRRLPGGAVPYYQEAQILRPTSGYDSRTCQFRKTDAWVREKVAALKDNPDVGVYFVADEPWQGAEDQRRCSNAVQQVKARNDLVKSIDSDSPTQTVIDSNSWQTTLDQMPLWKGVSDIIGLNPYVCYEGGPCDYAWIDRVVAEAERVGISRYWGVIQAHANPGDLRQPTPAELHELFNRWRATKMEGYLVFAWRWPPDDSSLWLANHPELQDQLQKENAR